MRAPPEKRSAPAGTEALQKIDCMTANIDNPEDSGAGIENQGINSQHLAATPVAAASPFGVCHTVYIRHPGGVIERRGLFTSDKTAALYAHDLNRDFAREGRAA